MPLGPIFHNIMYGNVRNSTQAKSAESDMHVFICLSVLTAAWRQETEAVPLAGATWHFTAALTTAGHLSRGKLAAH